MRLLSIHLMRWLVFAGLSKTQPLNAGGIFAGDLPVFFIEKGVAVVVLFPLIIVVLITSGAFRSVRSAFFDPGLLILYVRVYGPDRVHYAFLADFSRRGN